MSVFQPPCQPGRVALESQSPGCTTLLSTGSLEAGDGVRDPTQPPELQLVTPVAEGDAGAPRAWAAPDRGPVSSSSGVASELLASGPAELGSLPAGERVSRPEGKSLEKGSVASWGKWGGLLLPWQTVGRGALVSRSLTAAVPGYQHPSEAVNAHSPQFLIYKIDASNREQRLEDKGVWGRGRGPGDGLGRQLCAAV